MIELTKKRVERLMQVLEGHGTLSHAESLALCRDWLAQSQEIIDLKWRNKELNEAEAIHLDNIAQLERELAEERVILRQEAVEEKLAETRRRADALKLLLEAEQVPLVMLMCERARQEAEDQAVTTERERCATFAKANGGEWIAAQIREGKHAK